MSAEMGNEAVEMITMVMDKYLATKNYEVRSKPLHNIIVLNLYTLIIRKFPLGGCSNDQNNNGQKVWKNVASSYWRRLRIRNNVSKQVPSLCVLWQNWSLNLQMRLITICYLWFHISSYQGNISHIKKLFYFEIFFTK